MCHYLGGGLHGRQKRVKAQSESSKSVVNSVLISREMPVFPGFLEIIRVVMFNNMNIRHNNCAEGDKNYKKVVAKMSQDELESWYDETYQLCLLAFLELDNVERTKKVAELKASFGK